MGGAREEGGQEAGQAKVVRKGSGMGWVEGEAVGGGQGGGNAPRLVQQEPYTNGCSTSGVQCRHAWHGALPPSSVPPPPNPPTGHDIVHQYLHPAATTPRGATPPFAALPCCRCPLHPLTAASSCCRTSSNACIWCWHTRLLLRRAPRAAQGQSWQGAVEEVGPRLLHQLGLRGKRCTQQRTPCIAANTFMPSWPHMPARTL